ncbi:MAG TPA: baseplate J/gp47 family protein [Thermoanaerobaculia bacterium]|nr:baseplate J/gp47 family protein [Thermoanaerobaculia bacterium]
MSEEKIIQNLISQLGQSQDERLPRELQPHFVDVDERTPRDLLLFTKKLAGLVNYYQDGTAGPQGDWQDFFPYDEDSAARLLEDSSGATTPHLALLIAFFELYDRFPREAANRITERHLDFYYRRVLGFEKKAPVPDRAHVLIELKKNAPPVLILPDHRFSGGKDVDGIELVYAPTRATVIGGSRVDSLRSVFVDGTGQGTVRFAPIANSSDGVGGKLEEEEPKWRAFGHRGLPAAEVGFAISSPVLRMAEGSRKVSVSLRIRGLKSTAFAGALEAFVTGEKSWLGPYGLKPSRIKGGLRLDLEVPQGEPAVVDYDPAIHGYAYSAKAPVLQVLLKPDSTIGYRDVKGLILQEAQVIVEVSGVTSLTLESDAGALNPKKSFLPFGPQPAVGSRFMVGCTEALSKKLSEVSLTFHWQGAPADFKKHYSNYGVDDVGNAYFTAAVSFEDAGSWKRQSSGLKLFDPRTAEGESVFPFESGSSSSPKLPIFNHVPALLSAGSVWAARLAFEDLLKRPVLTGYLAAVPKPRSGFITLALEKDFLHETYRRKTIQNALKYGREGSGDPIVLNEPYTPSVQSISLSYKARTDDVKIESASLDDFANPDVQFFHSGCFGQMREHGYQRQQFDFVTDKRVPLFPSYDNEGELLVGVAGLEAGGSVSTLFQVAEGSADPDLPRQPVKWHVLCDNYWKKLGSREVVLDTTNQLLTSGVITFVIPREATTENTILPGGQIWLKAAVRAQVDAVSQLVSVAANAVEVELLDAGIHPEHLIAPLPKGGIVKLKTPIAAVKKATQPYASFGGRPEESDGALNTRASERLRHKNRCITAWDYERVVLEAFPGVHKVKCIPHAKDGSWLAPGNVLVVVVPDLRNKNARDRLRPRVDSDTIARITEHLQSHAGMQVAVRVKNPDYQRIRLDFKVRFHTGYEPNYHKNLLNEELVRFLSPWAYDAGREIAFGGRIYKSVLLDFVDELGYVDYLTDFKMHSLAEDLNEVRAERPDAILVSEPEHSIEVL